MITPKPREREAPEFTPPAVMPYAKLQLAAAKRAEAAEKAKRSKPASRLLIRKACFFSSAPMCHEVTLACGYGMFRVSLCT